MGWSKKKRRVERSLFVLDRESRLADHARGASRSKDADILLDEALGQVEKASLVKDGDKSNAIDLLVSGQLPKDGAEREGFEAVFEEIPAAFTPEERDDWMKKLDNVVVSSDAFVRLNPHPIPTHAHTQTM